MELLVVPLLLTCGPAVLSTFSVVKTMQDYRGGHVRASPLWAIGGAWLVAVYAAAVFLYYTVRPSPNLPPWKDPETLDLALLFVLAPVGLIAGALAAFRGASRWAVIPLVAALLVLFFVGLLEGASV
jgi:hypothetical protein